MATEVLRTDTFEQWRTKTNTISTDLGTVASLTTTDKTSAVNAVNELKTNVGNMSLTTTATNLTGAINELKGSSITFAGTKTFSSSINLTAGNSIVIDSATVLSKTSLGSGVVGSSLTSVGTIGTGTWQGTIIDSTYGGTGVNNGGRTITLNSGNFTLNTGNLTLTAQSGGSSVTVPSTGTLATLAGTETLSGKTINLTSNTLTGTLSQFNTALSDDDFAVLAAAQTLTNKTIALGSNTISGNLSQFNTALTDDDFAALAAAQTLTNKSLVDSSTSLINSADNTKKVQFALSGISTNTTRTLTVPNSSGTIALAADTTYVGTTAVALNRASASQALTGILSVALPGSTSGTITIQPAAIAGTNTITFPATTGNVVTTGDSGTVTNTMLAGSIANAKLSNSSVTFNGTTVALGASGTITSNTTNVLTIGDGLSGTSFNGSAAVTIAADSTIARRADTTYVGTTSVALNRTSANQALTGISSVALPGSTSGTITIQPAATAGTNTITFPATTGNVVTTGDSGTVTNTMLAGSIANAKLSNSAITIAGTSTSLGGTITQDTITGLSTTGLVKRTGSNTLAIAVAGTDYVAPSGNITGSAGSVANALTIGTGLSGTSYNGSSAVTIANTGVLSIAGTTNQVVVSQGTGSGPYTGAITLALPQSIGQSSNVTFNGLTLATLNLSDTLTDTVNIAPASAKTLISVTNNHSSYTPFPNRFTVDSEGNVTVQGTLTVVGGSSLGTVSSTIGWDKVVNKVFYGKFTDGTTTAAAANISANDNTGDTFKYRGANGVTVTVGSNDGTHGDNLLIGLSSVPNSSLANSKVTIGTTEISLGASSTTLAGLTQTTFASGGGGTIAIAPGSTASAISLTLPTSSGTLVVQDSSNYAFQNIAIGGDSGYTWGSANSNTTQAADSNTDTLTIVRGLTGSTAGIDLFTSTVAATDAIKIAHADTSALSGGYNPIAGITVDEMGHVTAVTSTNVTVSTNSIGTSSGNLTLSSTGGTTTLSDNVVISGNLTVSGTTTTINSTTLDVADLNITVAKGAANAAAANGAGMTVDGANATMLYTSATERWVFNRAIQSTQGIQGTTYYGTGAGLTAGTVGNAALANSSFTVNGVTINLGDTVTGSGGLQGTQGTQGRQGIQGTQGAQGIQGIQGTSGSQGITGTQGTQGAQGITGSQGTQGAQGIIGTQGAIGSQGITGTQGAQGITGAQGTQGAQGIIGSQGTQGTLGTQGITGAQGAQGTLGSQGITGIQGAQGIQGYTGPSTAINATANTTSTTLYPVMVTTAGSNQTPYLTNTSGYLTFNAANGGLQIASLGVGTSPSGTSGEITGAKFIKTSGTSSQFLKADGSVDSSTYLTSSGAVTSIVTGVGSLTGNVTLAVGGGMTLSLEAGNTVRISNNQTLATSSSVQFGSLGVGTAASGTSGEIRATDNVTAYYSSDERLKTNITKIDDALNKVSQIDGVIYDWTDEYKQSHGGVDGFFVRDQNAGIIAQQVEKVFPNIVAEHNNGYKAVRYELLVPLLIEAIKELKAEVDALKIPRAKNKIYI